MVDLQFRVVSAEAEPFAVAPLLAFKVNIDAHDAEPARPVSIHAIALRCQVRIDPARRRYTPGEQDRLRDLFGDTTRWGQTLRSLLWAHAGVMVPPFDGTIQVALPIPCTFDFTVAATKYFDALEGGEVPLTLLFSGTVFYQGDDGALQVAQIPWDREATFGLPVAVWRQMMDRYYPNSAWLSLRKDVFDRLHEYKRRRGIPTWEQALESLLAEATP